MKTTGTSKVRNSSLTASRPELPSAKLNVGEDQAGPLVLGQRHRIGMGARDTDHVMAEVLHQALEIHRDEGLVLDDQHIGGDFRGHFASGRIGEPAGFRHIDVENEGDLFLRKTFQRQAAGRPDAAAA